MSASCPTIFSSCTRRTAGVALYGDKVYMATVDAGVVALDAKTGEVVWDVLVGDYTDGYYSTLSLMAADGKIITGVSGGEFGIRGYVMALDAETGAEAWKTYTIPGPGEPGHETWKGDSWKTGGGSVWMQPNYDAETGTLYVGTGNGGPWMPDTRPGDNLYTTSVIAVDIQDGAIKGHSPVPLERRLGLGRGVRAAAHADQPRRTGGQGARACRAQRLPLVHGGARTTAASASSPPTSTSSRTLSNPSIRRPGRPTYSEEHTPGHRQDGDILSIALGWQGLAAGGLQPRYRPGLHSEPCEPVLRDGRRADRGASGRANSGSAYRST